MPSSSAPLVLQNGHALVGAELRDIPFRTLRVNGDQIDGIVDGSQGISDADHVNLDGAYVLPGLIDAHVHLDLAAEPFAYQRWGDPRMRFIRSLTCLHNGLVALRRGVTSLRDLGSVDSTVIDYATQVKRGNLTGPRVIAAGRPITVTGGHCSQYGRTVRGLGDLREAVREQAALGAGVIKVMASGGISTPGDPSLAQFTLEEMRAAVDEAHRLGLQVAAHAHAAAAIELAVEAGVDTIEHAAFADDVTLDLMVRTDRTLVPTVSALNHIADHRGIPAETVRKSVDARETYRRNTRRAIERGVRIAAGTDAGTALNPIGGLVDELEMYCERGMSAIEALRTATVNAGLLIGPRLGMVERGYRADLLVVAEDPRDNIRTLREPIAVISRGRQLSQSWLDETIEDLVDAVSDWPTSQRF